MYIITYSVTHVRARARNRMSSLEFHTLRKIRRDYTRIRCSRGDVLVRTRPDLAARADGNYALNYKYRQGGLRETDYTLATYKSRFLTLRDLSFRAAWLSGSSDSPPNE